MAGLRKPILYNIINGADATVAACYPIPIVCFDYVWFLQAWTEGTNAEIGLTIEASNDGIHWDVWTCETLIEVDGSQSVKDSYFGAVQMRICINPKTNTSGTVSANVNLKTV